MTAKPDYDAIVTGHYDKTAAEHGTASSSTMPDEIVRAKESAAILKFVTTVSRAYRSTGKKDLVVADVGCGNGYTLNLVAGSMPAPCRYVGVEYNDKLRALAERQLAGLETAKVIPGDLRDPSSIAIEPAGVDILICQRVLINLLDPAHQKTGLDTIVNLVRPGGALLFIEAFASGLARLNEARSEFGLEAIKQVPHNMWLPDDFFAHRNLRELTFVDVGIAANLLSTHYFVTRVLHDVALLAAGRKDFIRNSHFVRFFSAALPDGIGDYAPLRVNLFEKAR